MKKYFRLVSVASLGTWLTVQGCGGSSSDPTTNNRDALNPPSALETVTGGESIELRFNTANTEKDFKGYQVFGYKGSIDDVKKVLKYPKTTLNLEEGGIPRCQDNNDVFTMFGFAKASEAKCSGGTIVEDANKSTTTGEEEDSFQGQSYDQQAFTSFTLADDEKLLNRLDCVDGSTAESDANVSLPISGGKSLGAVKCVVTHLKNSNGAKTALEFGNLYTFFVVAVKGDKYSEISWTSNFIEDAPSKTLFSGEVTFAAHNTTNNLMQYFTFDTSKLTTALTASNDKTCAQISGACTVSGSIASSESNASADAIYIGRDSGTEFKQRLFVATKSGGNIKIAPSGSLSNDPLTDATYDATLPGDVAEPADSKTKEPYGAGKTLPVYPGYVVDILITKDSSTEYYGKLVFGDITLQTSTDAASIITANVTLIVQPKANTNYYMH